MIIRFLSKFRQGKFANCGRHVDTTLCLAETSLDMVKNTKQIHKQQLMSHGLFAELTDLERAKITSVATAREVKAGNFLVRSGTKGDEMFFLQHGRAKVCRADSTGKEVIIGLLGPGACIGELALLTDLPRTADVVTLSRCEVLQMSRAVFLRQLEEHPQLVRTLLKSIATLLGRATAKIADLTLSDVRVRLMHVLVEMGLAVEEDGEQYLVVRERPTHQMMADMIGATRETVTRTLSELEQDGHIEIDGERVVIF
jgi:CRP/FNR family cyclic AMP-dependent transcriptional regulator